MTKEEKLNRFKTMNKEVIPGQIVCAGSSLMEMFPVEKFIQELNSDLIIYNRGIGGYVTDELLSNIQVCILDLKPSKLFLNIGTNDLSNPDITIREVMEKYGQILSIIKKELPEVKIYLMAYYPVNYDAATEEMKPCLLIRTNEKIKRANEAVQELASEYGAQYMDINAPLKDENGNLKAEYTIEGMHIKEEGYRAIFPEFMRYVDA